MLNPDLIVILNSSRFGQGNPRLGEALMEDFFEAILENESLPSAFLFYNSAVVLCSRDSKILPPLKALEEKGCQFLVSEESLQFYNYQDGLEAGKRTTMDEMTKIMLQAKTILQP